MRSNFSRKLMVKPPYQMKPTTASKLSILLLLLPSPLHADGLQDLVRPNLDMLRESAEKERLAEEKRLKKLQEEEMALRLEEERKLAELEAAKADPLVDINDLKLAEDEGGKDFYVIGSGGTLGPIAAERYGSAQYYPVIEYWNEIKATKIFVGQKIKTPSVATIIKVKGQKVLARYPEEVTGLLDLRRDYLALDTQLYSQESEVTSEQKEVLNDLYKRAKTIHAGFLVKRPGVSNYANGLLAQCKNIVDQLEAMKGGDLGRRKSRVTRVHTSMAYALINAMVWGQEDFK